MADPHLLMFVVPFLANVWWTKSWLMDPIVSRWRFATAALVGTLTWIYLAYAATRVIDASGGQQFVYESMALAYVCGFLALVSFIGGLFGLLVWTEESGEDTLESLPDSARARFGD